MSAFATAPLPADHATINAANAQHSTGPKTEEGKNRVRFNALKLGIFAHTIILPDESQSEYEALAAHFNQKWQPRTDDERELVITILNTTWRFARILELESSLYAIGAHQQREAIDKQFGDQPPDARYALARAAAYLANPKAFEQISRQEGRLQRSLDRAVREIRACASRRLPIPVPFVQPPAEAVPQPGEPAPNPSNGFVPSKYPAHMPVFAGPHMVARRQRWLRQNGYKNLI